MSTASIHIHLYFEIYIYKATTKLETEGKVQISEGFADALKMMDRRTVSAKGPQY